MSPFFLLALLAGLGSALGLLFLKRTLAEGAGYVRTLFCTNMAMAVINLGLVPFQNTPVHWEYLPYPLLAGVAFFAGQACQLLAIKTGDVSVVTPTMGTKVILVALLSTALFGRDLPPVAWWAVLLAALAVGLLGFSPKTAGDRRAIFAAIGWALLAAFFFGLCDNLVSEWSPLFGRPLYIPISFLSAAVLSFALIPFFREPLRTLPRRSLPWVALSSVVLALQALLLAIALSYTDPTANNILYSSRALWSVVLVSTLGPLIGNREGERGRWVLAARFLGASLILLSIFLLLTTTG